MRWLSIETSSQRVSLALGEGARCLREAAQEGNASCLVEPLFRRLEVDFARTRRCVIGQGPGSYNGLRVGYAFLKGLLCCGPVPVVQVSTPLIMAAQAAEELGMKNGRFLVLNNARRGEIYGALVILREGLVEKHAECVAKGEIIHRQLAINIDAVVTADFRAEELPLFRSNRWILAHPSAAMAGRLAFLQNLPVIEDLSVIEPIYVREPVPK